MSRLRQDWFTAAVLAGITYAVFSPALEGQFVNFDDYTYVSRNKHVTEGLSVPGMRWAFTTFQTANWHPLTWLSLQLDATLWGKKSDGQSDPQGYHFTNVLLHSTNVALLFLALRALTGTFWRSTAVALLFAVHPLRVESVAWISERKDVLSICFGLLALWAYARYVHQPGPRRYLPVALALALSLLCKPTLVTLPCLMLVLDWWPLERVSAEENRRGVVRTWVSLVVEKLPLFALVAASSIITYYAQANQGAVMDLEEFPLASRVANAAVSYVNYLAKTLLPINLAAYYPHPGSDLRILQTAGATMLLMAITVAAVSLRRRAPYFLAGWLWYVGTLVPVIGLVQVGNQSYADRYSYFPQIGMLLTICWGVTDLARSRPRAALAVATAAAFVLAALTVRQIEVWHDSLSLWKHAKNAAGESATTMANLGETLEQSGHVQEATHYYQESVRLAPKNIQGLINLGNNLERQRKLDEAAAAYEEIIRIAPDSPKGYTNLGIVYKNQNKLDAAAELFEKACFLAPQDSERQLNMGMIEVERGNFGGATEAYKKAIDLDPNSAPAYAGLGVALLGLGKNEEGLAKLRESIERDPTYEKGYTVLGKALASQKDFEGALSNFKEAARLNPNQPWVWYNLGVVLGRQGHSPDAANCFIRAVERAPGSGEYRRALLGMMQQLKNGGHQEQELLRSIEDRLRQLDAGRNGAPVP